MKTTGSVDDRFFVMGFATGFALRKSDIKRDEVLAGDWEGVVFLYVRDGKATLWISEDEEDDGVCLDIFIGTGIGQPPDAPNVDCKDARAEAYGFKLMLADEVVIGFIILIFCKWAEEL